MKVEALSNDRIKEFVAYCRRHKTEVDESYLYDDDLDEFTPDSENPTYVVTGEEGEIVAAASLVMDEYHRRGKRARFRIFHSERDDVQIYQKLMKEIIKHTNGLEKVFLFVPVVNEKLIEFIEAVPFSVERYTFLLVRDEPAVPYYELPEGYEIRPFQPGMDEETWCQVRNAGFAELKGNDTPITPEMAAKMSLEKDYLAGGMMILYHHDRPVGVVRGADDEYEGAPIMNIGPIAIIPEYQGKGLGRILLRASMQYAMEQNYAKTVLCVNGENERAKALYLQEGFQQVEAVVCYQYYLT